MKHFINNIEVTPRNIFDIGVSCDFSATIDQNKLTTDSIILPKNGLNLVKEHINTVGLFEGLPYEVQIGPSNFIKYYVDFTQGYIEKDIEAEINLKLRNAHDNFFDQAEGLTFEYLSTLLNFDLKDIAYQIQPQDAIGQSISLSLAIYSISVSIADQVRQVNQTATEFIAIAGYGFSAIGKIIEAGLKLAISIVYLAILVFQAKKLIERLIEINFPKVRYLKACTVIELLQKGCANLGYSFSSTILENDYKNLMIIPIPLNKGKKKWFEVFQNELNQSFNKGFPTAQDTTPTLASLLSAMESQFNAKVRVFDGIVQLERWDFNLNLANQQISSSLVLQAEAQNRFEYDFSRLFKRYLISFQTDYSDLNTIDYFENSNAEYSLERSNVVNQDLNLIKGLTTVNIPFSRATPKTKQTWLEKRFSDLYKIIDKLAGTNLSKKSAELGIIQISSQFFSISKLIIFDGVKKVSPNENSLLSPTVLWDKFHYINNPLEYQFIIKREVNVQMSSSEFERLINKNYAVIDGLQCEIINLQFFEAQNKGIISYKEPKNIFKNNLNLIKVY
jgi:hypothetical protein